jgi:hypothetical protein
VLGPEYGAVVGPQAAAIGLVSRILSHSRQTRRETARHPRVTAKQPDFAALSARRFDWGGSQPNRAHKDGRGSGSE